MYPFAFIMINKIGKHRIIVNIIAQIPKSNAWKNDIL